MAVYNRTRLPRTGSVCPAQRHPARRRGVLSVEMALAMPAMLLLLFASYEIARANMLHHAAENAAYEAARAGVVPGATVSACQAQAAGCLRAMGVRNFQVRVTPSTIRRDTPQIDVEVEVPLSGNTTFAPFFLGGTTFRGQCAMQREAF